MYRGRAGKQQGSDRFPYSEDRDEDFRIFKGLVYL